MLASGGAGGGEDVAAVGAFVHSGFDLGVVVAVGLEAGEDVGGLEASAVESVGVNLNDDDRRIGRAEKFGGAVEHEGFGSLGVDLEEVDVGDAAGGEVFVERDGRDADGLDRKSVV